MGSQGPGELLPDDTPLSAEAVSRAGWAVNAFRAGSQIPPRRSRMHGCPGDGVVGAAPAAPRPVPWTL